MARAGELVTREEIVDALWSEPAAVDVRQGINTAVTRLRAALNDDPVAPRYIETVIGRGYRFIASVEQMAEPLLAGPVSGTMLVHGASLENGQAGFFATVEADGPSQPGLEDQELPAEMMQAVAASADPVVSATPATGRADPTRLKRQRALRLGVAIVALLAVVSVAGFYAKRRQPATLPAPWMQQVTRNDSSHPVSAAAISPDGQLLAYTDPSGVFIEELATGRTRFMKGPKLLISRVAWFRD